MRNRLAGQLGRWAMAYDETTSSVVFFGGLMGGRATNATWVFHGGKWSAGSTQPAPPGLTDAAFGWDAGADGLVMFAGTPNGTDTWTWSRGKWQQVQAATPAPSGCSHTSAVAKPRRRPSLSNSRSQLHHCV